MNKAEYKERKIERLDSKKSKLKTLLSSNYKQYENKYWRTQDVTMENHQTV